MVFTKVLPRSFLAKLLFEYFRSYFLVINSLLLEVFLEHFVQISLGFLWSFQPYITFLSSICNCILTFRMHQKHAGHAEMHAEMIFILLVVLLLSQIVLIQWRKHRPYSYHLCTLVGQNTT